MSEELIHQAAEEAKALHLEDGEYLHQTPYFTTGRILYPSYLFAVMVLTAIISLNQKKYRKRYKVDSVFFFIAIYLTNFVITYYNFKSIPKFIRVAIPCALMFLVSWFFNKFQIIGLTGGIATGKSTVTKFFKERIRMSVIDCDVLARRVVEPGKPAYQKIVNYFGPQVLLKDSKEIDRKLLGSIIFSNSTKRAWLTRTTGLYIFWEILKEVFHYCYVKNEQMVILDAPILFESKYLEYFCYPICCVYISDETVQVKRLMERDKINEEEAVKKIKSQMSIHKKMKKSDILVSNDGNQEQLNKNISKQLPNFIF